MKPFYPTLMTLRSLSSLVLFVFCIGLSFRSAGQVFIYKTTMSGPAEATPNNSPGTGTATVTINGNFMRVQTSFSGLQGLVTAAHIHAATALPGTGAAGVATQLPTFPGFPSGVQAGSYDQTFDMTLASSYNTGYINNNGGTAESAFQAFKAALNSGRAYLNIHSNIYTPGEIRGFLVLCPTINVTIPDAFALPQGVLPNTVYPAYAPASSLTLTANVSGGMAPYTFSWSNGANTASTMVSPSMNTSYTVSVQDQRGCPGMATKMVNVMNVGGGKNGDKIMICHKGKNTLTIGASGVADHLGHGDMLGECMEANRMITNRSMGADRTIGEISAAVLPNPSRNYFDLQLGTPEGGAMQVRVYNMQGRIVEQRSLTASGQTLRLGTSYSPGIYLVEIVQGAQRQTVKLIKSR